jgi:anti-sigma B factor antagonist
MVGLLSAVVDTTHPGALVLHLRGEVDISTAGTIRREWVSMIASRRPGQDVAIVDLSGVDFFGSSGLAALLECQHSAAEQSLGFRVAGARPAIARPFAGTGLIDCFDWYATLDEALPGAGGAPTDPRDTA